MLSRAEDPRSSFQSRRCSWNEMGPEDLVWGPLGAGDSAPVLLTTPSCGLLVSRVIASGF